MTYVLKNPKSKVATPIILTYYFNGRRFKLSTGESVHPDDWNGRKQRPRATVFGYASMVKLLDRLEVRVKEIHLEMKASMMDVTPSILRDELHRSMGRPVGKKENLVEFWEEHLKTTPNTVRKYALDAIRKFPRGKEFVDITPTWMEACATYLLKSHKHNTVSVYLAAVKYIMTQAAKARLHRNESYKDYSLTTKEIDTVYLTIDELKSINAIELTGLKARVRDRFLIMAFTGLRFSDNKRVTMSDVRDGMIFNKNKKTGTSVVVPIHYIVKEVMNRNGGELPEIISYSDRLNKMVRDICKSAGIINMVPYEGKMVAKYKLVASHTARRSFCTNAFLAGIPAINIRYISGHKSDVSFMRYIKASSLESAISIADHGFFHARM